MKRLLALMCYVVLAAACVAAPPAPSPTPTPSPVDVPSGSCIFTLDVSNESPGSIYVQINDTRVATIPAQEARRFINLGGWPEMPWHVLLIRISDGATLGESNFTSDQIEGHMTARDQGATANARDCEPA